MRRNKNRIRPVSFEVLVAGSKDCCLDVKTKAARIPLEKCCSLVVEERAILSVAAHVSLLLRDCKAPACMHPKIKRNFYSFVIPYLGFEASSVCAL
jgi:hypothetical protein